MRSQKKTKSKQNPGYIDRINRVLDYIYSDLARPLRLAELAELAELSPFHFHRVFQAMIGETPNEYVNRLRLEKSLHLMCHGKRKSLTNVALECGFSSASDFTRSFKKRFDVAPSKFDVDAWQESNLEQIRSATDESPFQVATYGSRSNPDQFCVRIRELPQRDVAYIRVSNPYAGDAVVQAANRLMAWVDARQVAHGKWLGYQFENPRITALEHCYYCVAVELKESIETGGEIGLFHFPSMLVADVEMKGDIELEIRLLRWLYGSWLPRSKYLPADQPCFESWSGRPFQHGFHHFELSIQLPIMVY